MSHFGDKMQKISEVIMASSEQDLYKRLISRWQEADSAVVGPSVAKTVPANDRSWLEGASIEQNMMLSDMLGYLPDDILVKVDRAAMGVSLETRVPMLDPKLVEFALRLPVQMKIRGGEGKWLLRKLLYRYVPEKIIDRPKMGFAVPIDSWLRGSLRDWAENLLDETHIRNSDILDCGLIRKKWREHLEGKRNWQHQLWSVLMLQLWLEEQRK